MDQIEAVVANTPPSLLQARLEEVEQSLSECEELGNALESHCVDEEGESHAPSLGNIRGVLNECRDCLQRFLRGSGGSGGSMEVRQGGEEGQAETARGSTQLPAAPSGGRVQTREDAFRALLQVADFFRRTEPHSPVSYALEQAVRWGRMSLPGIVAGIDRR
jgi:type VI secretion system protein ImpA